MKYRIYILYIMVLALVFFGLDASWGYMAGTPWWTHLTFHFTHGNIFHLAANMLVVFILMFMRNDRWWLWLVSFVAATACSFAICTDKPTVGMSGMLFVYYGIVFLKDGVQWKPIVQTLVFMAVSCLFASRMAIGLHFVCLFAGTLIGGLMALVVEIKESMKRYG